MSSNWDEHGFDDKIQKILASVVPSSPGHHLGTPFLTAYQSSAEGGWDVSMYRLKAAT